MFRFLLNSNPCPMNTKTIFRAVFNAKNRLAKDGTAPIHIEVYKPKEIRKYINTGLSIDTSQWNHDERKVIKHTRQIEYNRIISEKIRELEDYEFKLFHQGFEFTLEKLENFLSNAPETVSFTDFWEKEHQVTILKRGTKKEHAYSLMVFKEFRPGVKFDEIDYNLISRWDYFLKNRGLAENTIYKHHQNTNRFIRKAKLKKLFLGDNPYDLFKSKKVKSKRENLTIDQVKAIENLKLPGAMPELFIARDLFLFSCYCGLRFSDIQSLKYSDLKYQGTDITLVKGQVKVNEKPVTLPLHLLFKGKPQDVIKKYIKQELNANELIFNCPSNQHINRCLKTIAQMAAINMSLTFHIARHTFGTLLAELTQNPYLIMDLMGHADIQTSMIYIHRSQERINKQLRNVDWKI